MPIILQPLDPPDTRDALIAALRLDVANRDAGIAARDQVIAGLRADIATRDSVVWQQRQKLTRAAALLDPNNKTVTKAELRNALR